MTPSVIIQGSAQGTIAYWLMPSAYNGGTEFNSR